MRNLTIENIAEHGQIAGQAIAAFVASDRTSFYNCAFKGYQDILFLGDTTTEPVKDMMLPDFFELSIPQVYIWDVLGEAMQKLPFWNATWIPIFIRKTGTTGENRRLKLP